MAYRMFQHLPGLSYSYYEEILNRVQDDSFPNVSSVKKSLHFRRHRDLDLRIERKTNHRNAGTRW